MDFNKKLYVPDIKKWTKFYMAVNKGNVNPYTDHTMKGYQRGGGLRNKTSPYMLSIDTYTKDMDVTDNNPKINMTSPAEQIVEQAKSEVKREKIIKKDKRNVKRPSQKASTSKGGPPTKRSKVVQLKSDVFGPYWIMSVLSQEAFREAMPSQLSLFDIPPTQTAVENIYFQDVRPISQISGSSPIEFQLSAQNGMDYIDLKRSRIYVKLKVMNGSSVLTSDDVVGPVNLLLLSLFSQVDVSMQNKPINSSGAHYPYLSMLNTLINYGSDAKSSQLTSQLWKNDTSGEFDDANATSGRNSGLLKRTLFIKASKSIDLEGPIMHELFQMDRYILNQVGIALKFYRTRPEFCLLSTTANGNNYNSVVNG
jgi:hypothetical protein